MSWLVPTAHGVELSLHVQPGARTTGMAGLHGDALKVRIATPAVDGKANAALVAFLAAQLDLPGRSIEIVSGSRARTKRVRVRGVTVEQVRHVLGRRLS